MKKIIAILLPLFILVACGSSGNQESSSEQNPLIRKENISKDDFENHFGFIEEWYSTNVPDYKEHTYTYTTVLSLTISQLRSGFVTYSGSAELEASVHWKYFNSYTGVIEDKTLSFTISFSIRESVQSYSIKKEFKKVHDWNDGEFVPESEIPYYTQYSDYNPYIRINASNNANIVATYHNNGISGSDSLFYTSFEINIANYQAYFKFERDRITPIDSDPLFDYRVTAVINGTQYTIRRDGTRFFDTPFANAPTPDNVYGYIDVYPGRII